MADEPTPDGAAEEPAVPEPERRAGALVTWSRGQEVLHPSRAQYVDTVRSLKEEGLSLIHI